MDGISQYLNGFVSVANVVGNIASVLGFFTLLGTILGYLITHAIRDPFGDKAPKGPRYRKFFESLVAQVGKRDKRLSPPDDIGPGPSCVFETEVPGIAYYAHFIGRGALRGKFAVYLDITASDSDKSFQTLEGQKESLVRQFRKQCRDKKAELAWEPSDVNHSSFRIAAYYPGSGVIDADAKKLKQMRKWAVQRLVAFRKVFDQRVPGAAAVVPTARAEPAAVELAKP